MGTCACIIKPSILPDQQENLCNYPSKVTLRLKNFKTGEEHLRTPVELYLTKPLNTNIESITINSQNFLASFSILPGQDPHGNYFQKCMDSCMYLHNDHSLLLCLFDGHGPEGEQVVNFCCSFTNRFFKTKTDLLRANPEIYLKDLIELCDESLRSSASKINTDYSGTYYLIRTAIILLVYGSQIFTASVGDSRAVLASLDKREAFHTVQNREENSALAEVKMRRTSKLSQEIFCLQLTKEHKPDDKDEAQRILDAGGRVKRLTDSEGNRIGPYRVWESLSNSPGLTMSRSIGDSVAKTIGVTSEPDISHFTLNEKNDLFIVLGTDGIWDVMNNEDVLNFVESFREKSNRTGKKFKETPCLKNSCISQLLCEEARVRWMAIVEEDNVSIDDISCMILEINKASNCQVPQISLIPVKPKEKIRGSVQPAPGLLEKPDENMIQSDIFKDPRRGSQINFDRKVMML